MKDPEVTYAGTTDDLRRMTSETRSMEDHGRPFAMTWVWFTALVVDGCDICKFDQWMQSLWTNMDEHRSIQAYES